VEYPSFSKHPERIDTIEMRHRNIRHGNIRMYRPGDFNHFPSIFRNPYDVEIPTQDWHKPIQQHPVIISQ